MQLPAKHEEYWRRNLAITAIVLAVGFLATFVEAWFGRALNNYALMDFPLGFYMAAQGSLVICGLLVWIYATYMKKLDKDYKVDEGELE